MKHIHLALVNKLGILRTNPRTKMLVHATNFHSFKLLRVFFTIYVYFGSLRGSSQKKFGLWTDCSEIRYFYVKLNCELVLFV